MKTKFTIGVFGIIKDKKNRILLCLRNDYDLWNLPGGTLEAGEAPWQCVIREVKEETGLIVKIEKLICIYSKEGKNAIGFDFICKIVSGKITLNDEAKDIKWFSKNRIPKNTVLKQAERIKEYFGKNTKIIMRTQKGQSSITLSKEGKL